MWSKAKSEGLGRNKKGGRGKITKLFLEIWMLGPVKQLHTSHRWHAKDTWPFPLSQVAFYGAGDITMSKTLCLSWYVAFFFILFPSLPPLCPFQAACDKEMQCESYKGFERVMSGKELFPEGEEMNPRSPIALGFSRSQKCCLSVGQKQHREYPFDLNIK